LIILRISLKQTLLPNLYVIKVEKVKMEQLEIAEASKILECKVEMDRQDKYKV